MGGLSEAFQLVILVNQCFIQNHIQIYIDVAKGWFVCRNLGLKPDWDGYRGLKCRTEG